MYLKLGVWIYFYTTEKPKMIPQSCLQEGESHFFSTWKKSGLGRFRLVWKFHNVINNQQFFFSCSTMFSTRFPFPRSLYDKRWLLELQPYCLFQKAEREDTV